MKHQKSHEEISKVRSHAAAKDLKFLDVLIAKVTRPMKKTEIVRLAVDGGHGSYYLANKYWSKIEARLLENKEGLFSNPEQQSPSSTILHN